LEVPLILNSNAKALWQYCLKLYQHCLHGIPESTAFCRINPPRWLVVHPDIQRHIIRGSEKIDPIPCIIIPLQQPGVTVLAVFVPVVIIEQASPFPAGIVPEVIRCDIIDQEPLVLGIRFRASVVIRGMSSPLFPDLMSKMELTFGKEPSALMAMFWEWTASTSNTHTVKSRHFFFMV